MTGVWCDLMTLPVPAPPAPIDIEFPLKTRGGDATGAQRVTADPNAAIEPMTSIAASPRVPLPFLADRLLSARAPFGLEVEVKSEERVVGTWKIEVNPRDAGGAYVSQAKANLYVCASGRGDARATGAFLVVRQWWVRVSDRQQIEQLYKSLSVAALERLDALLGSVPDDTGQSRACVLFLVDGRRHDRKPLRLDRLQIRLLADLEGHHAIAGVDLSVAHGRGTGTRPSTVFASTLPAPLSSDFGAGPDENPSATAPPRMSLIGEVFVRETVSAPNVRWNRRASDRVEAMLRPAVATATEAAAAAPIADAGAVTDDVVVPRELTSMY